MEQIYRLTASRIAKEEFNINLTEEDLDEILTMIPDNLDERNQPIYVGIRNRVAVYLILNNKIDGENVEWMD